MEECEKEYDPTISSLLSMAEAFLGQTPPRIPEAVRCLLAVLAQKPLPRIEARTRLQLGLVLYHHTNNLLEAREHLDKAVLVAQSAANLEELRFEATSVSARILVEQQCFHQAKSLLRGRVDSSTHYPYWHLRLLLQLADVSMNERDEGGVISMLSRCAEYARQVDAPFTRLLCSLSKGAFLLTRHRYQEAGEVLNRTSGLMEEYHGDKEMLIRTFYLIVQVSHLLVAGQVKAAKPHLKQLQQRVKALSSEQSLAQFTPATSLDSKVLAENFQWLTREQTFIMVYLVSVMHSVQGGYTDKALSYAEKAMQFMPAAGDKDGGVMCVLRAHLLEQIIQCLLMKGDTTNSGAKIQEVLNVCQGHSQLIYSHRAVLHTLLGLYAFATESLDRAAIQFHAALQHTNSGELRLFISLNLALTYMKLGESRATELTALMKSIESDNSTDSCQSLRAALHYVRGLYSFIQLKLHEAKRHLRETLLISNKSDLNRLTTCSLIVLGQIFLSIGNTKETMDSVSPAMQLASKIPDKKLQVWAATLLADLYHLTSDQEKETTFKDQSFATASEIQTDQSHARQSKYHNLIQWTVGEWPVSPVEKSQASEPIWRKTPAGQGGDADWNMSARKTSTAEDHAKVAVRDKVHNDSLLLNNTHKANSMGKMLHDNSSSSTVKGSPVTVKTPELKLTKITTPTSTKMTYKFPSSSSSLVLDQRDSELLEGSQNHYTSPQSGLGPDQTHSISSATQPLESSLSFGQQKNLMDTLSPYHPPSSFASCTPPPSQQAHLPSHMEQQRTPFSQYDPHHQRNDTTTPVQFQQAQSLNAVQNRGPFDSASPQQPSSAIHNNRSLADPILVQHPSSAVHKSRNPSSLSRSPFDSALAQQPSDSIHKNRSLYNKPALVQQSSSAIHNRSPVDPIVLHPQQPSSSNRSAYSPASFQQSSNAVHKNRSPEDPLIAHQPPPKRSRVDPMLNPSGSIHNSRSPVNPSLIQSELSPHAIGTASSSSGVSPGARGVMQQPQQSSPNSPLVHNQSFIQQQQASPPLHSQPPHTDQRRRNIQQQQQQQFQQQSHLMHSNKSPLPSAAANFLSNPQQATLSQKGSESLQYQQLVMSQQKQQHQMEDEEMKRQLQQQKVQSMLEHQAARFASQNRLQQQLHRQQQQQQQQQQQHLLLQQPQMQKQYLLQQATGMHPSPNLIQPASNIPYMAPTRGGYYAVNQAVGMDVPGKSPQMPLLTHMRPAYQNVGSSSGHDRLGSLEVPQRPGLMRPQMNHYPVGAFGQGAMPNGANLASGLSGQANPNGSPLRHFNPH